MSTQSLDYNSLERKQAHKDGATLVPNSGRGTRKGDARLPGLLIDYKFTDKKSFAANLADFRKHQKDAWKEQLEAVVVPVFIEHDFRTLAIVDWEFLKELMQDKFYREL